MWVKDGTIKLECLEQRLVEVSSSTDLFKMSRRIESKKPSKFKRGPVTISWLIGMMVVMMMVMTTTMMKMVMMTVAFEVLALKREEKKGRKKKPVLSGQKLQLIR